MQQTILVVDDDGPLASTIASLLNSAGFEVITAYTAEDGLQKMRQAQPQLAILDIMVPVQGGLELCRQIRTFSDAPIIFLTALGDVEYVVRGLEIGADDYIVKPFRSPELVARIKAHMRRAAGDEEQATLLKYGDNEIAIDLLARQVTVHGEEVEMTPREYDLLITLAQTPGRVRTTADLLREAWGINEAQAGDNIKPYIHYLRKKLEDDPASPRWILTVRGVGYRFANA
jgi:DNA-binding response OmpR family regulator